MSDYIDKTKKPYPYCPGCSHGMVMDAVDRALEKVGGDPRRTVLVTDIGCVGIADKYFTTHTFHGLHGRSFTYACGIKLASPELNVFVLAGDGGCGIGGHHLINAARRNIGITVICFNNFNFGMTGGEHSVTTPTGGKTNTTLSGNIEQPFDLCALVQSAGGTFVARKTSFEADLDEVIARAMRHSGFSFVDIAELCTAYYSPMNAFKKKDLEEYMKSRDLKTGILVERELPELAKRLSEEAVSVVKRHREKAKGRRGDLPEPSVCGGLPCPQSLLASGPRNNKTYDILLAGSAGMKIISAAGGLAKAAILSGLWVSEKDDYPVTVQTGHSTSILKLSAEKIDYLGTSKPDAVIVVSADGFSKAKVWFDKLGKEDVVVVDKNLPEFKTKAKVCRIDLNAPGLTKTNKIIAAIAFLLKETDIIKPDAYKKVLEKISDEKIREGCLKAFEIGIR